MATITGPQGTKKNYAGKYSPNYMGWHRGEQADELSIEKPSQRLLRTAVIQNFYPSGRTGRLIYVATLKALQEP
ncbi:hypothetical protein ANCDUO_10842 [Ancylostoma duodenale]|uniref:Uncharacterized protein n=1 Tax=Ancylostoma duodenale TaxID=51022 RepID=A0A0C2D9M6_9BILA|nr:hypothetical protein ANCDUO_10842 [Ancylostoma duodenale]